MDQQQQTPQQQAAINHMQGVANEIGALLQEIAQIPDVDMRWLAVARTHLQEGFMFVKRAIANPLTSVPGFKTEAHCAAAGERAKGIATGTKKSVRFACVVKP